MTRARKRAAIALVALVALALGAPAGAAGAVKLRRIGNFDRPVYVTGAPGFGKLLFVVEQAGRVRVIRNGRRVGHAFLNISRRVSYDGGERGLLSIAFPPDYRRTRRFYVYYTDNSGDIRVDEFKRRGPTRAARGSRRTVIRIRHRANSNHNGGQLQFLGHLLYLGSGDGGSGGDPPNNAQDRGSLLGKIIRIDPRNPPGPRAYSVPRSNPFVGRRGRNEIFSFGLRNPYRFSFDRRRAGRPRIAIGDVGQGRFEEIDYETVGAANGANFGWDAFEGFRRYTDENSGTPDPGGTTKPIFAYSHNSGGCAVIGGYVVRDRRLRGTAGPLSLHGQLPGRAAEPALPVGPGATQPQPRRLGRFTQLFRRGQPRPALRHLPLRARLQTGAAPVGATENGTFLVPRGRGKTGRLAGRGRGDLGVPRIEMIGRSRTTLIALMVLGALAAALPVSAGAAVELKPVGQFERPTYVAGTAGAPRLLFVVEQAGRIEVVRRGHRLPQPFLDISDLVGFDWGERGLLSMAFPPDYRASRRFYVYYTNHNGNLCVDEFLRSRHDPTRALASTRRRVITIPHPNFPNHNGGQLQFLGNLLYLGTGDGGSGGDPHNNAQDKASLLGKLIRIDPRTPPKRRSGYSVPPSNPFTGRTGLDPIFSYGLRNPYRFSFDLVSSARPRIVIADVGQGSYEEIDYETVGGASGANFGWDAFEGFGLYSGDWSGTPNPGGTTKPIFTYDHSDGRCAVIGGYVVRDPRLRGLRGRYVYTDACDGRLRSFRPRLGRASGDHPVGASVSAPGSFGEDAYGRLYVTSLLGPVYRLVQRG